MSQAKNHSAANRFARFANRPEIRDVTRRYADLIDAPGGQEVMLTLSFFGLMRAQGQIPRRAFNEAVAALGSRSDIPRRDMKFLAMYALENSRCALAGIGSIAFTPENWDNEEGGGT